MKYTLKEFITEQLQEMGIENEDGRYLTSEEIIDQYDELVKSLDKEELSELIIDFTELEYEQSK